MNKEIKKSQKVHKTSENKVWQMEGILRVSPYGTAFLLPDEKTDWIRVDKDYLNTGLHGDRVNAFVRLKNGVYSARIKNVLSRKKETFVGILKKSDDGYFYVQPQDPRMYVDILIKDGVKYKKHEGKKVLSRIDKWEDPRTLPEGHVLQIIGIPNIHETEIQAVLLERGIASDFNTKIEKEAALIKEQGVSILEKALEKRLDYRNITTFTIDPQDAKDFDDALSYKELENGDIEIGVHIADVTHYLQKDTLIDKEAVERGTSTYLVDRTVPMLPEVLSNDLCSLRPNEDKLAFSVLFTFSKESVVENSSFKIKKHRIEETIINSDKRFTYEEAQKVLDEKKGAYCKELNGLNILANKLAKENKDRGAISFSQEEVKFVLDKNSHPVDVIVKTIGETNDLVEQFMLLANKTVTKYIHKHIPEEERLFLYRTHDTPDKERVIELMQLLHSLGYKPQMKDGIIPSKELNRILQETKETPESNMVQMATIRSMAKAIYSIQNIGHFGLAFTHYTHFTSPIRRYPDVIVHRLIKTYKKGGRISKKKWGQYKALALTLSDKEKNAMEAERASVKYKQVEYMKEKQGEIFEGIITGITAWGLYVEEKKTKAEGSIKVRDLTDDYYIFKKEQLSLIGTKNKKRYRLGDNISIKI
ncbi:MAG: ribonuclease R, partial [Candidatus Pacebacteria bacterium]|nr:ribonuclease R [Candidatus Paceibacterota bacterium]